MKLFKGFLCFLAWLGFCAGLTFYLLHNATSSIVTETIVSEFVNQMSDAALLEVDTFTSLLPEGIQSQVSETMINALPQESKKKVEEVKGEIINDPKITELSKIYMDALLNGAISGSTGLPNVNQNVQEIAQVYIPQIAQAAGVEISEAQAAELTAQLEQQVDLSSLITEGAETLNTSLSTPQKKMLSMIQTVQSNPVVWISVAMMITSIVVMILCTLSPIKWLLYVGGCGIVSGLGFMFVSKIAAMMLTGRIAQLGSIFKSVGDGFFDSLFQGGLWCFGIGIVCCLIYGIVNFLKNHLVYE